MAVFSVQIYIFLALTPDSALEVPSVKESFTNAAAELRRAEHLLYVSLKYTRTVDVIKNVIERLISTFEFAIDSLLIHAKEQKRIEELPAYPRVKITTLETLYATDPLIIDGLSFLTTLKKISKARFDRAQEYRRHVTMTAHLDNQTIEVTIDLISEYYAKTETFLKHVLQIIKQ